MTIAGNQYRMRVRASTLPEKRFTPTIWFCVFHECCTRGRSCRRMRTP